MARSPVTPSLFAPNVTEAVRFYVDVLGFSQTGTYKAEDDGRVEVWAEVSLGDRRLWFFSNAIEGRPGPAFSGLIYIFVDEVDAMASMLEGKVKMLWGPETQEYGLRELGIEDCNGYILVFAKDV